MIEVYPDLESLSRAAAALLVTQANLAVAARGRFSVALAGGNTPRRTYELLASPPFWIRCPGNGYTSSGAMSAACPSTTPGATPAWPRRPGWTTFPSRRPDPPDELRLSAGRGARQYEAQLREFFAGRPPRLDLVLLGLGDNGHTASLFPGTPVLKEKASAGPRRSMWPKQDLYRVTLTAPFINQAAVVAFLVAGGQGRGLTGRPAWSPRPGAPAGPTHPAAAGEILLADDLAA